MPTKAGILFIISKFPGQEERRPRERLEKQPPVRKLGKKHAIHHVDHSVRLHHVGNGDRSNAALLIF